MVVLGGDLLHSDTSLEESRDANMGKLGFIDQFHLSSVEMVGELNTLSVQTNSKQLNAKMNEVYTIAVHTASTHNYIYFNF